MPELFPAVDNFSAVAGGEGHFLSEARDAYGAIRVVDKFQAVHIRIVQAQRERIDEKSDLTLLSEQDGVCKHTKMDESAVWQHKQISQNSEKVQIKLKK